jgi:hypothetical protein
MKSEDPKIHKTVIKKPKKLPIITSNLEGNKSGGVGDTLLTKSRGQK